MTDLFCIKVIPRCLSVKISFLLDQAKLQLQQQWDVPIALFVTTSRDLRRSR